MDERKRDLQHRMAEDQRALKALITESFVSGNREKIHEQLEQFFRERKGLDLPYTGVLLLGPGKRVFAAYSSASDTDTKPRIGSSYSGIDFEGNDDSLHKVLTLYRVEAEHPMGRKGIEMAFEMEKDRQFLSWLVFQMDTALLENEYHLDEEGLQRFHFEKP
jgi:hypothetical protein